MHTAQHAADEAADGRHRGDKARIQDRHAALLDEIDREPGQEEVGDRGDAVLRDVDAEQHAIGEQLLDEAPLRRVLLILRPRVHGLEAAPLDVVEFEFSAGDVLFLLGLVHIDQRAALFDVVQFGRAQARMVLRAVNDFQPDEADENADDCP